MQFRKAGQFIYLHAVSKLVTTYDLSCKHHNCQWGGKMVTETNMSFMI